MGMYDNVDYEMICPVCGDKIDSFQTKNGECVLRTLTIQQIPDKGYFYSSCHKCGLFVEFQKHSNQTAKETKEWLKKLS